MNPITIHLPTSYVEQGIFPLDMFEGRCDAIVINVDSVSSKTKEFPFDYQKGSE